MNMCIVRCVGTLGFAVLLATAASAAVNISNKPTQNMSCTSGVCTPTAKKAYLNVDDLTGMLAAGDVTIGSGSGALDIQVEAPFSWTSAHRLTLDAGRSIIVSAQVEVVGSGALTLMTKNAGELGRLSFVRKGRIRFWDLGSNLVINGRTYALIGTVPQLAAQIATDPNGHYALAKDYDASKEGILKNAPVQTTFNGRLEGLGHAISNLSMRPPHLNRSLGLFLNIGTGGSITNLSLLNVYLTTNPGYVGGLTAQNYGKISDVQVTGNIYGGGQIEGAGGIAGENFGTIIRARANVSVFVSDKGFTHAGGGIAGQNYGTIQYSSAEGSVGGGCCADNEADNYLGGLVGENGGAIEFSYATADTYGADLDTGGGLTGLNSGNVINSYATGANNGDTGSCAGGLMGANYGTAADAYATGVVSPGGGLICHDFAAAGSLSATYWDMDTSGITDPSQGAANVANDPGITGLTDAQLKSGLPAGFDTTIWGHDPTINNGYPYLLANPPRK